MFNIIRTPCFTKFTIQTKTQNLLQYLNECIIINTLQQQGLKQQDIKCAENKEENNLRNK